MTQPPAKLLDISLIQLIGGSMAAATAAALGSRLGVVGTITGAAVGSVVTAIAASLYTGSITRARHVIATNRIAGGRLSPVAALGDPAARAEGDQTAPTAAPLSAGRSRMAPLRSAAAVFVVAAAFLAGFQLATGTSVTGTTVGTRPEVALPGSAPASADPAVGRPAGASASGEPVPSATTAPSTATAYPTSTGTETAVPSEHTTTQPDPGAAPSSVGGTPTIPVTPAPPG